VLSFLYACHTVETCLILLAYKTCCTTGSIELLSFCSSELIVKGPQRVADFAKKGAAFDHFALT